jgi:hypothetical protein
VKAFETLLDQKRRDAAGAGIRIRPRIDDENICLRTVRDPHFRAIEHVAVAAILRPQPHGNDIGAGTRFAHRERADMLAAEKRRQVALLLLFAAVAADLVHAQIGVGAVGKTDRG